MYYPLSVTGVSSNITVAVIGSWQNETVVDCGCNFETNCNSGNATRAFIMGLKGIVSVSDLTVRNCGGSPQVDEAKLLKTPLHELPFPRDVWDGIASDNSATRRSRLGGGILIETYEKLKPWQMQHSLNVTNVRFLNNWGVRGGAVAIAGTENKVFLHNNSYANNYADISGGAVHFQVLVGIPSASSPHLVGGLSVTSSSFSGNSVDREIGHGGALSVYGGNAIVGEVSSDVKLTWSNRLHIEGSDFYNNTAFMGGALFATGDTADSDPAQVSPTIIVHDASELRLVSDTIETTSFRENVAEVQGGGVSLMHVYGGITVKSSILYKNIANGLVMCPQGDETCAGAGGGMISVYAPLTIIDSFFKNNTAETNTEFPPRGGGLFAFYDTHGTFDPRDDECPRALILTGGQFLGNIAYSKTSSSSTGGAIWMNGGATIEDVSFEGNMASSETIHSLEYNAGGAIYVQRSGAIISDKNLTDGPIRMENNTFTANEVKPGGYGGAIFAKGNTEIELINQRFFNNVVTSSQRIKSAGGAVAFVSGVTSTVTECYFEGNSAVPYQGQTSIIHVSGATMPMPDGLSGEAGALFLEASSSVVQSTTFKDNFCSSGGSDQGASGGAVSVVSFLEDAAAAYKPYFPRQPIFNNVKFISNSADSADKQGLSIADKSSGIGGAVHVLSAAPEFLNCVFKDNIARAGGSKVSLGGAVALRYAYAAYSDEQNGEPNFNLPSSLWYTQDERAFYKKAPKFIGCNFTNNMAVGEDSDGKYASSTLSIMQSGRGGAIGAVASMPFVSNSTFIGNTATARARSIVPSLGGAVYLDYDSEGYFVFSHFKSNSAQNGAGSEICSISVGTVDDNDNEIPTESSNNNSLSFRSCEFSSSSSPSTRLGWPAILIFGGMSKLLDCEFHDEASVIVAGPGFKDIFGPYLDDVVLAPAKLDVGGSVDASKVDIFSWNADLSFSSIETTTLDGLKVVNGTVSSSSGITVLGSAWIFGARLCGCNIGADHGILSTSSSPPIFEATSKLNFGRPDETILPSSFTENYPRVNSKSFDGIFSKHVPIVIDNLEILIAGNKVGNKTGGTLSVSIPLIHLNNSASINIQDGGELRLETATTIEEHINPLKIPALVSRGKINHTMSDKDQMASLTVVGNFEMLLSGSLSVELPSVKDWNGPIWKIDGEAYIEGSILLTFADGAEIDERQNWTIGTYTLSSNKTDDNDPKVLSPDKGVKLSPKINKIDGGKSITIHVDEIHCDRLIYYHPDDIGCYACLQKKSGCTYCGSENGENACQDEAAADALPYGSCSATNCCPGECSDHGVCNEIEDEPVCECEWFFEGKSCDIISTSGTLVLTCGVSLTLLCLISVAYYQFHNRTKREVVENALEELRVGLLASEDKNHDNGKKGSIHVGSNYIQDLQQQLLLKDVAVPIEEVNVGEEIGSGTYGVVYKGTFRGSAVAVKMVRAWGMGDAEIENFKKEAYLMSKLRHPNIVLIMGIAMKNPTSARTFSSSSRASDDMGMTERPSSVESLYILSEYMERGSLADVIEIVREEERQYADSRGISTSSAGTSSNNGGVGWNYELILACALQAARGMQYLHNSTPPICHRDLKSSNLVVDDHWVVKVTDFGVSRMLDGNGEGNVRDSIGDSASPNNLVMRESTFNSVMTGNIGTTAWAAPEILVSGADAYGSYSLKVDVYSFGVVLWELWERESPFKEFTSRFDMADAIRKGARPQLSKDCPEVYTRLYEECVRTTPSERPNFAAIVKTLKEELTRLREEGGGTASEVNGGRGRLDSITASWRGMSFDRAAAGGAGLRAGSKNSSSPPSGDAELKHGGGSWTGNGTDEGPVPTTPIRLPFPYARKHSIVNNVLSSPVLSPFFAKRPENYQELESDELEEFDSFEPKRNNGGERKSY